MHQDRNFSSRARTLVARRSPLALALAVALGLAPLVAGAATISVTSAADPGNATTCTLRQAIASMNAGALTADCSNTGAVFGSEDTIVFGTTTFPTDGSGVITLTNGQLAITNADLTIDAHANASVTIDANQASRVLLDSAATGATLTLRNMSLRGGKTSSGTSDCNGQAYGGGICIPHADLTLIASNVSGNTGRYSGGGIYATDGNLVLTDSIVSNNYVNGHGGGITVKSGKVTLVRSTVSGNTASTMGGGIYDNSGKVTLIDSTLQNNEASNFKGGGLYATLGEVDITGSTVSGNYARSYGGGIYKNLGILTVTNSTIVGNTALNGGGIAVHNSVSPITLNQTTFANHLPPSRHVGSGLMIGFSNGGAVNMSGTLFVSAIGDSNIDVDQGNVAVTIAGSGNLVFGGGVTGDGSFVNAPLSGDPKLAALTDNGGLTQTMMPQAGSAAIDAIACAGVPAIDQRGARRPDPVSTSTTPCDIGAVEANSVPLPDSIFVNGFEVTPP